MPVNYRVSITCNVWLAQGCRESWFAYACDENMRHSVCLMEVQRNIVVLYKNNSLHTPETYRGGVWKCDWLTHDNQLQTTHKNCFSQGLFFFSHKTNIKHNLGFTTVQQTVGKHCNKTFWEDDVVQFLTWTFLPPLSSKKITLLVMGNWSDLCL